MGIIKKILHKYRSKLSRIGLILIASVALWYVIIAADSLIYYFSFRNHVVAEVTSWEVKEIGENQYSAFATFSYAVANQEYQASSLFPDVIYLNEFAAKTHLEELKKKTMFAWYSKGEPRQATLDRSFPGKQVFNAGVLVVIFSYFLGVGRYLKCKTT